MKMYEKSLIKKYFMCMGKPIRTMYVWTMCAYLVAAEADKDMKSPGIGVTDGCELGIEPRSSCY